MPGRENPAYHEQAYDVNHNRFVPLGANMDVLSKHRDTQKTVNLDSYSYRPELHRPEPKADYCPQIRAQSIQTNSFKKMKGRDYFDYIDQKKFKIPEQASHTQL